jgi:hypothetical protein
MSSNPAINPYNYNIDYFQSTNLGPITDTNFRTFLFTHNLPVANSVISGVLGGNPWQDRATEYDVSQSLPNVVDVPNLQDVAQNPSVYNNLTNPRQVNLTNNLPTLDPQVQNILGQTTPIQAGLGQDVTSLFNPTTANIDLPGPEDAAQISSTINNFTTPRYDNLDRNPTATDLLTWYPVEFAAVYNQWAGDYDTSYGVPQTLRLGFAGNVEEWVYPGNTIETANEIRKKLFLTQNNKWGPNQMLAYSYDQDEVVNPNTGLIQYSTGVQGDFRDQLFSRTLGVGAIPFSTVGSGINYKPDGQNISQLDEIGRKRRGQELLNRIKLNFTDSTIGALNVSPFSLLSGGNLIEQNYSITVPKSGLGKAAQFAADLAGFNLPTSIIPDGAFGEYSENPTFSSSWGLAIDVTNDILNYTGSGQKSLLYNALYINKYGPKLESSSNPPTTSLGKITKEKLGAGQAPNTQNYLYYNEDTQNTGQRNSSAIESINRAVKNALSKSKPDNAESLRPTEDLSATDPISDQYGSFYGRFEQDSFVGRDTGSQGNFSGDVPVYEDKEQNLTTYNGTPVEQGVTLPTVTNERFDWRATNENTFKRGLLKYTQDLVNKSKLRSAAGYIGYFDSEGNDTTGPLGLKNGVHQTGASSPTQKPSRPSKGNVARNYDFTNNSGGDSYCRSWTSRRKYHTWDNLVRSDGNWWRNQIKTDTLTMNYDGNHGGDFTGMPKIAWNSLDTARGIIKESNKLKGQVIPYMFSIENLAWKDAPQFIYLPKCEIGPNYGRIMWFPPYDINFSESTSVNWDSTNFIGRGEPIYTYNHTERSGTLDWTIVVDHSAALDQLRKKFQGNVLGDEGYNSYFAGCDNGTLKNLFADYLPENDDLSKELPDPIIPTITPCTPGAPPSNNIRLYFDNCRRSTDTIGRELDLEKYEVTVPSLVNVNQNEWNTDATTYPCGPAGTNGYGYLNKDKKSDLQKLAEFLVSEDGKNYQIQILGYTSPNNPDSNFNKKLGTDRANNTKKYLLDLMTKIEEGKDAPNIQGNKDYPSYPKETEYPQDIRWKVEGKPFSIGDALESSGKDLGLTKDQFNSLVKNALIALGQPTEDINQIALTDPKVKAIIDKANSQITKCNNPCDDGNPCSALQDGQANSAVSKNLRFSLITLVPNLDIQTKLLLEVQTKEKELAKQKQIADRQNREKTAEILSKTFVTECEYFEDMKRTQPFVYQSFADKIKYFHPAFHAITPEGFNSRLTFLQQCTRQGPQIIDPSSPQNMVFGRPPICVLRIGDFYHTKIVIDSLNITYEPLVWDLNPEGIGVQPMLAKVSLGFKFIGGSSLGGPIKQLQNAVSYNFFANTSVYNPASVPLEETTGNRLKFIYGAFASPKEEERKMGEISGIKAASDAVNKDDKSTNTTTDPKKAEQNNDVQNQIQQTPPGGDSTTKATEGDSKPPTTSGTENPSDSILTISKNNSGVQLQVNDSKWTLLGVEVDVTDNTGTVSVLGNAYGGNFNQDNITNTMVHDAIIQTFDDCPGKGCTLFDSTVTGNAEPNVNCTYIISVCEKENFPNGQKKTYNTTNVVKI